MDVQVWYGFPSSPHPTKGSLRIVVSLPLNGSFDRLKTAQKKKKKSKKFFKTTVCDVIS